MPDQQARVLGWLEDQQHMQPQPHPAQLPPPASAQQRSLAASFGLPEPGASARAAQGHAEQQQQLSQRQPAAQPEQLAPARPATSRLTQPTPFLVLLHLPGYTPGARTIPLVTAFSAGPGAQVMAAHMFLRDPLPPGGGIPLWAEEPLPAAVPTYTPLSALWGPQGSALRPSLSVLSLPQRLASLLAMGPQLLDCENPGPHPAVFYLVLAPRRGASDQVQQLTRTDLGLLVSARPDPGHDTIPAWIRSCAIAASYWQPLPDSLSYMLQFMLPAAIAMTPPQGGDL